MTGSILGERVLRKEDPKFLTTGGVYVDDMDEPLLEGGLHVTYARSTMAHARITGIDTSAAEASPGVVADLHRRRPRPGAGPGSVQPDGGPPAAGPRGRPLRRRARGRRRHASGADQGEDAAELVEVDYEPLEVLLDVETSVASSTLLYPNAGSNAVFDSTALGMPGMTDDSFFEGCDVIVTQRLVNQRVAPCPSRCAGRPRHGSTAGCTNGCRRSTRTARTSRSRRPTASSRTRSASITPDVGGGFGAKIGAYPEELLLGRLAKELGRPVLLAGDPQRVHGRPRPRPGPGAAHHRRRHPGRQGPRLPPARAAGLRCVRRGRHRPGRRDDAAHVVGRVRHPEDRVPHHLRRHQHHAGRGLPGGRAAGGDRGGRAGDGPVRGRDRDGPGRGAPGQPDPQVRRAPHHGHRPDLRRRRLRGRARQGARRGRLRRAAAPSRPSAARAATPPARDRRQRLRRDHRRRAAAARGRPASRSSTTGGPSSTPAPRRTGRATTRPGR